jgi:hypothetical protein
VTASATDVTTSPPVASLVIVLDLHFGGSFYCVLFWTFRKSRLKENSRHHSHVSFARHFAATFLCEPTTAVRLSLDSHINTNRLSVIEIGGHPVRSGHFECVCAGRCPHSRSLLGGFPSSTRKSAPKQGDRDQESRDSRAQGEWERNPERNCRRSRCVNRIPSVLCFYGCVPRVEPVSVECTGGGTINNVSIAPRRCVQYRTNKEDRTR